MMVSAPVLAQGATSSAVTSPTGNPYVACSDGTASEDRATCLKETGAAQAEARRGQLSNPSSTFDQNALQRCQALPADEQEPCRLRVHGVGTTTGSVAGGGVLREVVTPVPASGQAGTASGGSAAGAAAGGVSK